MFESPSRVLFDRDPAIAQAIQGELTRERRSIELIASENFTSPAVLEAPRNPAQQRKVSETSPRRRSPRRSAASPVA